MEAITRTEWQSRAVERRIVPSAGMYVECAHCGKEIKWLPKSRDTRQIICNVYENNKWMRMERYHFECYDDAGQPYGPSEFKENR